MKRVGALIIAIFVLSLFSTGTSSLYINSKPNVSRVHFQNASIDTSLTFLPTENFTHYEVNANLTWSTYPHVDVIEKVIFKNTYDVSFNELHMHAWAGFYNSRINSGDPPAFKLNAVVDEADNPLSYSLTGYTTLKISLPSALQPGETFTFVVKFEENLPALRDRYGYGEVHSKPIASFGNWLPVMAIYENGKWTDYPYTTWGESFYAKSACFLVNITTDSNMIIAATGSFLGRLSIDSYNIWMWNATLTRDFTFSASRYFVTHSIIHNGINITSYYVSEDADVGEYGTQVAVQAIDCYSSRYIQYPYDRVSIVETPMNYGGMEYPMLVQISDRTYSSQGYFEIVTAHELGHQWWAYLSGNDPYMEPWLDEGFASYSEYLYTEYVYGWDSYLSYLHDDMSSYTTAIGDTQSDFGVNHNMTWWENHGFYGTLVYTKGSIIVAMLRYVMGDDAFFNAMHDYFKHYAFRIVHIPDFQHIMESHYNASLDWFFDEWVYNGYRATFAFGEAEATTNGNAYLIVFTLRQYFATFTMPLEVKVYYNDSTSEIFRVWINETTGYYELTVDKEPIKIKLDPNNMVLASYITREIELNVTETNNSTNTGTQNTLAPSVIYTILGGAVVALVVIVVILRRKEIL